MHTEELSLRWKIVILWGFSIKPHQNLLKKDTRVCYLWTLKSSRRGYEFSLWGMSKDGRELFLLWSTDLKKEVWASYLKLMLTCYC